MDYITIEETFSIDSGRQKCYNFITRNDNIPEVTEIIAVTVSTLNAVGQVIERRIAFVRILDDDSKKIFMNINFAGIHKLLLLQAIDFCRIVDPLFPCTLIFLA